MNEVTAAGSPSDELVAEGRESFCFEFAGEAGEYFRIWIVNVALSLATLGIYSAWAKVRNRQYFYRHARIAGAGFDYTADPVNILKGRALVVGAVLVYQAATYLAPTAAALLSALLAVLIPWVVIKAVAFNHRFSAYRNLRFHFDGAYAEAFKVYVLWTLGVIVTLGIAYPYAAWRRKRFLFERTRYGQSLFGYGAEVGYFYLVYVVASLVFGAALVGVSMIVAGGVALLAAANAGTDVSGDTGGILAASSALALYALFALSLLAFNAAVQAAIANHVWSSARLASIRFTLRLAIGRVVWIQISNAAAIVASLGLLIPWARVRAVRYKLSCFTMHAAPGRLDAFVAAERDRLSAAGEEFGSALDLDLGL